MMIGMTVEHVDSAEHRKARGAFFTPAAIAEYVTRWAVRSSEETVLEPSCGEAAFLLAAARHLQDLGMTGRGAGQLVGAELHEVSASRAADRLTAHGFDVELRVGDFLHEVPSPSFDAVIGNPPYVRYQGFSGDARRTAQAAALRGGVALNQQASSWAAFTVHSALHLRPGGRLGLVLPAEMLSVNYAAPVRDFLMRHFARVRLVLFSERVFPGVMEEVVLLLAEGAQEGPTDHCELLQARDAHDLAALTEGDVTRWKPQSGGRWSGALVPPAAASAFAALVSGNVHFEPLRAWGDTTLGMVTGNNDFFALTGEDVRRRKLTPADVIRLSPPGSRHLRSVSITRTQLDQLDREGRPTWLFRPAGEPSSYGARYIREGQARGVDTAYKCRVRRPWWRVPYLKPADLLLTYMNADTARLCANASRAHHLNSVHGVYLRPERRELGFLLAVASVNSVTLLGAEIAGRAYGGGVLKMEPREADSWLVPSQEAVLQHAEELRHVAPTVRSLLASHGVTEAAIAVDVALGLSRKVGSAALDELRSGRAALHDRRVARSKG